MYLFQLDHILILFWVGIWIEIVLDSLGISIINRLSSLWNSLINWLSSKWYEVTNWFFSKWNAVKTGLSSKWNAVKTGLSSKWNAVKTGLSSKWDALKTGLSSKWNAVKKWWNDLHPFIRQLPVNLIIGLSVTWLMINFQNLPWLMEAEDASMDWLMQVNQNIVPSIDKSGFPPFVVLDIDDKTFQAWGEPLVIPRDKITHLIEAAVQAKARLILVTFDINRAIPFGKGALHPQDKQLKDYLAKYAADCKAKQDDCPTIILFRAFQPYAGLVQTPRTGFLDETVEKAGPYIQWASAQFYSKNVIRRGKLWVRSCTADKQPEIVPSMELLAMSVIRGCSEELQTALHPLQPKNCGDNASYSQKINYELLEFCQLKIHSNIRNIYPRIIYRIPWLIDDKPPRLP